MKKKLQANQPLTLLTAEDTLMAGKEIAEQLAPNTVVALYGDLGAGKTTLCKGIISSHCNIPSEEIRSPTFTYLEIYEESIPVYHFDLYRLENEQDFLEKGFEEYLNSGGICLIEWPQRIETLLPKNALHINLNYHPEKGRILNVRQ